ncbi:hypothetical protein BKA65DRAFT_559506 [Rhexocercosporidium sp. MPI-PUGE-AT-0058]|nr:hypothetical protein BKA65DRAFT_559506 [Rhexocercosporidium sp. MPI-PUGE-AT-0058]
MPAPHDKRFSRIYKLMQDKGEWSDTQLMTSFEEALAQAIHDDPRFPEDKVITKAMRAWLDRLNVRIPDMLSYDKQPKHQGRFGDAVFIPSRAPGTFWWNRESLRVQWVWWDPNPARAGQIVHTDPSSDPQPMPRGSRAEFHRPAYGNTLSSQRQTEGRLSSRSARDNKRADRGRNLPEYRGSPIPEEVRRFTPTNSNHRASQVSSTNSSQQPLRLNTNNNYFNNRDHDDDTMADMAPPASPVLEVKEEKSEEEFPVSRVVNNSSNATTSGYTDPDGSRVIVENRNEYLAMEAFITLKALKDGWIKEELDEGWRIFRDEIFPGRDPLTRKFVMHTQKEFEEKADFQTEHLAAGFSRTPSPRERTPKRAKTENEEQKTANGTH